MSRAGDAHYAPQLLRRGSHKNPFHRPPAFPLMRGMIETSRGMD